MTFKVGEIVKLRSGGPLMTVESVDEREGPDVEVACVWFERNAHKNGRFKAATLEYTGQRRPIGVGPGSRR